MKEMYLKLPIMKSCQIDCNIQQRDRDEWLRLCRKGNTLGKSQTAKKKKKQSLNTVLEKTWAHAFLFQPLAFSLDQNWEQNFLQ